MEPFDLFHCSVCDYVYFTDEVEDPYNDLTHVCNFEPHQNEGRAFARIKLV